MKRVANLDYLYERGGIYWFRRAVPEAARAAFGKVEVQASLRTRNLAEARHRYFVHLRDFDQTLAQATGRPDPTAISLPQRQEPTQEEIEAAVRVWLRDRLHRQAATGAMTGARMALAPEEEGLVSRQHDLENSSDLTRVMHLKGGSPQLVPRWIGEAIAEANGWTMVGDGEAEPWHARLACSCSR